MEGGVYYEGADSFLPHIRDGYSSHWDDASMKKGRGGCDQVPTSLWHGYPESDEVYILGWKRDDIPSSIGFGYGDKKGPKSYAWELQQAVHDKYGQTNKAYV